LRGILKSPYFMPILLVAIISVAMIILPLRSKTTLSRMGSSSILLPFIEIDKYLVKIGTSFEQNRILNRRLDSLSVLMSVLLENKNENERLRRMLEFNFELPYKLIPAEIIAVSPTSLFKSILIDAGLNRGVDRNMPVISPSGIIGKTIASDRKASTVQLLFDPGCKVAARIQRNRAMGIVEHLEGRYLSFTNVPGDQDVVPGDTVISSGLGGIFPEGLFIGTVIISEEKEGELFRNILVDPGADFSILDEVFVIVSPAND